MIEAPLVEIKEGTTQSHHQQGLRVKEVNLDGQRAYQDPQSWLKPFNRYLEI